MRMRPSVWMALLLVAATTAGGVQSASAAELAPLPTSTSPRTELDARIEAFMVAINAKRKPLPAWALDTALKVYQAYKTYRNGQRVEEVQQLVLVILRNVAELKGRLENHEALTENEIRLTRELLQTQSQRLDDAITRITNLEANAVATARELDQQRRLTSHLLRNFSRRGCGTGRYWSTSKQTCLTK